jgi:aliphatic nitrilase
MALITKRKRMMDSVGHYARPELLSLVMDNRPTAPMRAAEPFSPLPPIGNDRNGFDHVEFASERLADRTVDQRIAILGRPAG